MREHLPNQATHWMGFFFKFLHEMTLPNFPFSKKWETLDVFLWCYHRWAKNSITIHKDNEKFARNGLRYKFRDHFNKTLDIIVHTRQFINEMKWNGLAFINEHQLIGSDDASSVCIACKNDLIKQLGIFIIWWAFLESLKYHIWI